MAQNDNNNNLQNMNVNDLKQKISEQMPGLDVNNITANDVKNLLINEINTNKNINIDDSIKQKINNGDVDGLKEDIINYLSRSSGNDENAQQIVGMLKNNDMDGLQKKLLGMLFGGMVPQKKNEVEAGTIKPEEVKPEEVKPEEAKPEEAKPGEVKSEEAKPEEAAADQSQMNFAGIDLKSIFGTLSDKVFAGAMDDNRVLFLTSMRPFLSDVRQKSIDDCVRIMNLVVFFENFNNNIRR